MCEQKNKKEGMLSFLIEAGEYWKEKSVKHEENVLIESSCLNSFRENKSS